MSTHRDDAVDLLKENILAAGLDFTTGYSMMVKCDYSPSSDFDSIEVSLTDPEGKVIFYDGMIFFRNIDPIEFVEFETSVIEAFSRILPKKRDCT